MKTDHHYQKQGKINVSSERPMLGLKNLRNSQLGNHPTEHIKKGKKKKRRKEKERKLGLFQISRLANQPFDCRGESQFPKTPSVIMK